VHDDGRRVDPVAVSVDAYTTHADEYEATHAPKMLAAANRFAASLPAPSLILDGGCGPGRDLARFVAHGNSPGRRIRALSRPHTRDPQDVAGQAL
jgi:hypothetical protein